MRRFAIVLIALCVGLSLSAGGSSAATKKPGKPTLTSATASGETAVVLMWNKSKKAKGYGIYRNGELISRVGTTVRTINDSGLSPGTTYSYRVCGYTTKKQKQWYNKVTGKWQVKKPPKKARGKAKKVTVYVNGPLSAAITVTTKKHTHTFGPWQTKKPATCTDKGVMSQFCTCGAVQTKETAPEGHTWSEWMSVRDATCTHEGVMQRVCCNDTQHIETKVIEKSNHSWEDEYTIDSGPTCTGAGEKSIHCKDCDARKSVRTINPTGHHYDEWQVFSVNNQGYRRHSCNACGVTEQESLDLSAFEWEDHYTVDVRPTCETDGSESIHAIGVDLTRDSRAIPATGHDYTQATTPATCTKGGETVSTCNTCGKTVREAIPASGHAYETEVVKEPTCTEKGKTRLVCTACGNDDDEKTIPALGHKTADEWFVEREPTCTRVGYKARYCARCNVKREGDTIPTIDHEYGEYEITREPTCARVGRETATCRMCPDTIGREIAKLEHEYGEYEMTREPTCTGVGRETATCRNCSATVGREIAALGHDWGDYVVAIEPTCEEEGIKRIYCNRCHGAQLGTSIILEKLPHTWGAWERVTEPTCVSTGRKKAECTACGKAKTEIINMTGIHTYSDEYTVDSEPTQSQYGSESRHCIHCEASAYARQIPKIITQEERDFVASVSGREITLYCDTNRFERLINSETKFSEEKKAMLLERAQEASMPESEDYPTEYPTSLVGWAIEKEPLYDEYYDGRRQGKSRFDQYDVQSLGRILPIGNGKITVNNENDSRVQTLFRITATKNDESFTFNVRVKNYLYIWMENVLRDIVDECVSEDMSHEEKMLALVDYSRRNFPYGTNKLSTADLPGLLIGHVGICQSYTAFFTETFTMLGFTAKGHMPYGNHAECTVKLPNGDTYLIDGATGLGRSPAVDKLTEEGFMTRPSSDGSGKATICGFDTFDESQGVIVFPREVICQIGDRTETREVNKILSTEVWSTEADSRFGIFEGTMYTNADFRPRKVVIPNTVTYIEPGVFNYATCIEEIEVEEGGHFYVEDDALWTEDGQVLIWKKGEDVPHPTTPSPEY